MILIVHVSRKIAKILTFSRKSHHPIETLFYWNSFVSRNKKYLKSELKIPLFFSPLCLCSFEFQCTISIL